MNIYLTFIILGLGAGAVYAALAQGIILAYRGSGVVNFAHGAMAMYIAYFYLAARQGQFLIPPLPNPLSLVEGILGWFGVQTDLWDIPTSLSMSEDGLNALPAFVLAMAMAIVLGLLIHILIFRPLRSASPLAKTVGAVGLALTLQAIVILRFGSESLSVDPFLPADVLTFGDAIVPVSRLILLAFAVIVAIVLGAVFKFTYVGLATRAAAENERASMFIGLSPNRLAGFNWVLSSLIAGAAGILFVDITGLNPFDLVLFVIPALGAALIARFTSFAVATAAAIGIGILQSIVLPLQQQFTWLPASGLASGVPFLVIAATMIIMGDTLPTRASAILVKLPRAPRPSHPVVMTAILGTLCALALVFLPYDYRAGLINSLAGVVIALSLMVAIGLAGQISLMQVAIVGVSALTMTRVAGDWDIPFPWSPVLAIAVATMFGVITGLPALRVRGVEYAVLTLGAGYAFEAMVIGNADILRVSDETESVPPPSLLGFDFGPNADFPFGSGGTPSASFGLFCLVVVIAATTAVICLRSSRLGLRMLAMRANERAATALGVNVWRTKLAAFIIASALAGVAGVLAGYRFGGVSASQYTAMASVFAVAAVFVGGVSQVSGSLIAGAMAVGGIVTVVIEKFIDYGQYQILVTSVGLVLVAVLQPQGIAGFNEELYYHVRDKFRARRRAQRGSGSTAPPTFPSPVGVSAAGNGSVSQE